MSKWEQEIDSILASVDEAMVQAEALAKSYKKDEGMEKKDEGMKPEMKKEGMPEDKPKDEAPAPEAEAAPAPEAEAAPAPAEEGAPSDAPEAEAAPAEGEEAIEHEGEEGPISDDELKEIYGTMEPEELQRHFMIMREILRGSMEQGAAPEAAPAAPAPEAGGAPMAMSEKESIVKSEFDALKAKNEELEKALGRLTMVMESTLLKPARKAVTDIAYIQKSEHDSGEEKQFTKSEIRTLCNEKCKDRSLSKSDREALNDYLLNGGSSDKIMQIIKGGK